jgi:protein-L-isoaspartate(D-aspartate) O-methyltransferase
MVSDLTKMIDDQIVRRGLRDTRLLEALRSVPRELFVSQGFRQAAFSDGPLPIGHNQTISQPFIVAKLIDLLGTSCEQKVLEVGTGSGYQAAVLGRLVQRVYSVEIVPELADLASSTFKSLGYENIVVLTGDGADGWPEFSPFDRILLTASPDHMPGQLADQLAVGGRMVAPVKAVSG